MVFNGPNMGTSWPSAGTVEPPINNNGNNLQIEEVMASTTGIELSKALLESIIKVVTGGLAAKRLA